MHFYNKNMLIITPSLLQLNKGQTYTLTVNAPSVTWSTSNSNAVTVSDKGVLHALGDFENSGAIITAQDPDGHTAFCVVSVNVVSSKTLSTALIAVISVSVVLFVAFVIGLAVFMSKTYKQVV